MPSVARNPLECPCRAIAEPLPSEFDLNTLDHVCPHNARESVENWYRAEAHNALELVSGQLRGRFAAILCESQGLPSPAQAADNLNIWIRTTPVSYPYPLDGEFVGLVLRHWVESEPSPLLSRQLAEDGRWPTAQSILWAQVNPAYAFRSGAVQGMLATANQTNQQRLAGRVLRQLGLPDNPAVADYLFDATMSRFLVHRNRDGRVVPSGPPNLPVHGWLVTTIIYVVEPDDRNLATVRGTSRTTVSGVLDFTTGPAFERVGTAILQHRDWIGALWGVDQIATERSKRRHLPAPVPRTLSPDPASPEYDPEQAAFEPAYLAPLLDKYKREKSNYRRKCAIAAHIKSTYDRVRRRQERIGIENMPKGWRKRTKQKLTAWLEQAVNTE